MNNVMKMSIALRYARLHKERIKDSLSFDLMDTFFNLETGLYGEVRKEGEDYQIEINSHDSKTGNPVIFEFQNDDC